MQCALCGQEGQKATAVHYFLKCPHHEVAMVEHREQMMSEFHVAFADPELVSMQKVWEESTEGQQIRGMVCAIPSINPEGFWGNIDQSVRAFLKGVGEVKTFWEEDA